MLQLCVFLTRASVFFQAFSILVAVVPLELTAFGENVYYVLHKLISSDCVHRLPTPTNLTEMPNKRTHSPCSCACTSVCDIRSHRKLHLFLSLSSRVNPPHLCIYGADSDGLEINLVFKIANCEKQTCKLQISIQERRQDSRHAGWYLHVYWERKAKTTTEVSIRPQPVEACPGPGCGRWVKWTTLKEVLFERCHPGTWCSGRNLPCRERAKHPHTLTFLWASPDEEQRQNIKAAGEAVWRWGFDKKMLTSANSSLL